MRVLTLMHEDLVPRASMSPRRQRECQTESDVITGLQNLGHQTITVGLRRSLSELRQAISDFQPHIVFNLLEEFLERADYESHIVSYLEMQQCAYTGCNARGLQFAKDKAIAKAIVAQYGILSPRSRVFLKGKKNSWKNAQFPLIVKALNEESSTGLSLKNVVTTDADLIQQIERMHKQIDVDVIVEEYIDGREISVGVLGNRRLQTFCAWELNFGRWPKSWPRVATDRIKWDPAFQKKYFIESQAAEGLSPQQQAMIAKICKRAFAALHLSGYARIDLRISHEGHIYFIEANPNPNISCEDDFAQAARHEGISYEQLLSKILALGTGP